MSEVLIKPYELSIWDNELTNTEQKIAVIGTHLLKTPNMAYNIVFKKDKNGEKTLSFDIKHKYYDLETGQMVENPFVPYLINERKVKLFYNDEWYDFIIKEVEESSEEYTWSYVAYDAFVLELSKNGYDIEFSNELNNNLGTAEELAAKTLENTDWMAIDVDVPAPRVSEPIFEGKTECNITVKNMDTDEDETIAANTKVLIFYSYIINQNGKYLQFIKQEDNESDYKLDESTNTIIATNYRFDKDLTFEIHEEDGHFIHYIMDGDTPVLSYGYVYQKFDAYRMIYQQVSSYDAVMDRVVDQFTDGNTRINHYSDYIYITSNVVTSFVANGDNFSTYEDGSLYGWDKYGGTNTNWPDIKLTTYPEISAENPVLDINNINQIEGYLQVKFNSKNNSYLYNDGIQSNQSFIGSISKGDKFVFRWRGGKASSDHGTLTKMSGDDLRAKVCFYKEITINDNGTTRYAKSPISDIISFEELGGILNNIVSGGTLQNNDTQYILDGVVQVPSSKYLYATDLNKYYWDSNLSKYIVYNEETNQKFLDYYYLIGSALTAVTQEQLQDPTVKLGIFIYCNSEINNYYYLQDVQLTRLYKDEAGNILTIGNIPKATAQSIDYYYLTPKEGDVKNKIPLFLSLEDLANEYDLVYENIKPIFNQGEVIFTDANDKLFWVKRERAKQLYEQFQVKGYALTKVATIEASHSNCFDILQTIAETFECWVDIYVEHNEDGSLFYSDDNQPLKAVLLREFSGNDNFAGFKYGINIDQIVRTIDSNEVVTKLIVDDSNSDLVEDGVVSIAQADSNPSKESYIYRFDYFLNQGLLPRENFTEELNEHNFALKQLNTTLYDLQAESIQLSSSLVQISSNRNVYSSLLTNAHEKMNEALDEFEDLTSYTYEEYQQLPETEKELPENVDKVLETIGTIYNCAAIENSYRGLYTNIESEYTDLHQKLNGIKEHAIKISCVQGETSRYLRVKVDDYIVPFKFTVEGIDYETSLSNKEFEIEVDEGNITISNIVYNTNSETGYQLLDSNDQLVTEIIVDSQIVQTYRLVPNSPTDGINSQIDKLIKQKKELIKQFNIKYGRFVLEGNWSSQDYLSDELYYLDATIAGRVSAFPKVTYNINVVDISGLNDYQSYNFDAGEKTYIEDTEFFGWTKIDGIKTPVQEEVIISDIEWHLDDPSQNTITVQNYKTHFEDLFQRIQATVQTVQYNEVTYPNTRSIIDEEKRINQALLVASLSRVAGAQRPLTTDGSIAIDGDSIDILNLTNRLNRVRLSSEGITISSDGGVTWSAAITGEGINIGNVISDFINTKEIWIGSKDSPSFRWDNNGISAFRQIKQDEITRYDFKQFVRFDQYGLYGIDLRGKTDSEYVVSSLQDIKNDASFAVTWDGFFIKNKYTGGGRVEITSMDDFRVINGNDDEVIKIGALEWGNSLVPVDGVAPTKYGIRIRNNYGEDMFVTGNDGNLAIVNTLRVGAIDENDSHPHIVIDGQEAYIKSSNYSDGAGTGWMINKDGDAYFNNITARGAIKTAVFEYAEIQAVGGVFIFRPSSTIRSAIVDGDDLILTVEKPVLFKVGDWCKVSNYTENGEADNPDVDIDDDSGDTSAEDIAKNNGLLHIYQINNITTNNDITYITLDGAAAMIGQAGAVDSEEQLFGGALVDMGDSNGESNYGIGINSSDNTVNLPAKAISLFETVIGNSNPKVTYKYTAILGTLPPLPNDQVSNSIYNNLMADTQGIYTDNMYIGDSGQYIAFYTDKEANPQKHLIVQAKEFTLETTNTIATQGYIYLSNTDKYLSGNLYDAWRLIIGSNFKVSDNGNLYAANANISGDITASSGHIANWTIETKDTNTNLYPYGGAIYTEAANSSFGDSGNVYITPGYTTNSVNIGGSNTNNETWTIVAGNGFGVTTDGKLYANNAKISGNIAANSGTIGNWHIEPLNNGNYIYGGALYTDNYSIGSGVLITPGYTTTSTAIEGSSEEKIWTITAGSNFGVTTAGKVYAKNAKINGIIEADTGRIGGENGWTIAAQQISRGTIGSNNSMFLATTNLAGTVGGKTFSSTDINNNGWRLTVGSRLGVDNVGNLYGSNVNLSGIINVTGGTIGSATKKINIGSNATNASIYYGMSSLGSTSDGFYIGADGISFGGGSFRVDADGTITATGLKLTSNIIEYNSSNWAQITTDGLEIYQGNQSVALYGDTARIGKESAYHTLITSDSFSINDENGATLLDISPDGDSEPVTTTNKMLSKGTSTTSITTMISSGRTVTFFYANTSNTRSITFPTTHSTGTMSYSISHPSNSTHLIITCVGIERISGSGYYPAWNVKLTRSSTSYSAGTVTYSYVVRPLLSFCGTIEADNNIKAGGEMSAASLAISGAISAASLTTTGKISCDSLATTNGITVHGTAAINTLNLTNAITSGSNISASLQSDDQAIDFTNTDKDTRGATVLYVKNKTSGSDRRIKKDIVPLDYRRDLLIKLYRNLKPVEYKIIDELSEDIGENYTKFGFIAQEIEETSKELNGVLKSEELVFNRKIPTNSLMANFIEDGIMKNLDYQSLHALHTLYAHYLEFEIEQLKKEVAELKNK